MTFDAYEVTYYIALVMQIAAGLIAFVSLTTTMILILAVLLTKGILFQVLHADYKELKEKVKA